MTKNGRWNYMFDMTKSLDLNFETAYKKTIQALKDQGFGVLTEINVKETLKQKLDVNFDKYVILGACNPPFAHKALEYKREIGLLLPCNVCIWEKMIRLLFQLWIRKLCLMSS